MLEEGRKSKLSHPTPPQTGWISPTSPHSRRGGAGSSTAAGPRRSDGAVTAGSRPVPQPGEGSAASTPGHGGVPREKGNGAGLLRAAAVGWDGMEKAPAAHVVPAVPRVC